MRGSEDRVMEKRSLSLGDDLENEVDRSSRKRKSEQEEISSTMTSVIEKKGDRGVKKIEITALSLPDGCSSEQVSYFAPIKKRKVIHQISIEKVDVEPDPGGDAPRFKVCFRDVDVVKSDECDIEHDLLYEKTLRKGQIWRKILPGGREAKTPDDPEGIEKRELRPRIYRPLLTYAIAQDVNEKASIFIKIRSLLMFVMKTLMLMFSAFGSFSTETYFFSDAVSSVLMKNCIFYNSEGQANTFETISNLGDVKTFVDDCFKVGIAKGLWGRVGVNSGVVLLTPPRFRQVRVVNETCLLSLYNDIICHNSFSEESESKEPFGSGSPVGFVYSRSQDEDVWFRGYYAQYNSHGYTYLLSDGDLLNEGWVDTSTAAIFIDFTLYSGDATLFCVVQFLFEFPPTGRVKSSYTSRALFLARYNSAWGHFILATEIMFVFLNVLKTVTLLVNLSYFKWRFFRSVGLLYNFATTLLCWCATACLVRRFTEIGIFFASRYKPGEFTDFQPILREHVHCDSILVLACLFNSFDVYGFLNIDLMSHLKITLQACFKNIVVFTIAFTIIVWEFVQVAYLLFGHSQERYRTFLRCFSELMKVTLGDLDFEGPRSVLKTIGPIFILLYVISVVFVFINMFFAIINGTFTFVANNVDIEEESYSTFLVHCWHVLRVKYLKGSVPKTEEKKLKNSERIRNLLLHSGYSNDEIKMFFCRYIVDDVQAVDEAVFAKMWNLRIPPQRLGELKALVQQLETAVDLLLYKAEWLSHRIRHVKETRLGRKNK